jgi:hypothetical protein
MKIEVLAFFGLIWTLTKITIVVQRVINGHNYTNIYTKWRSSNAMFYTMQVQKNCQIEY